MIYKFTTHLFKAILTPGSIGEDLAIIEILKRKFWENFDIKKINVFETVTNIIFLTNNSV